MMLRTIYVFRNGLPDAGSIFKLLLSACNRKIVGSNIISVFNCQSTLLPSTTTFHGSDLIPNLFFTLLYCLT